MIIFFVFTMKLWHWKSRWKCFFHTEKTHFQCDFQCHNFIVITTNYGYCLFLSIDPRNRCLELSPSKHKTLITLQTYPPEKTKQNKTNKKTKTKTKTKKNQNKTKKQVSTCCSHSTTVIHSRKIADHVFRYNQTILLKVKLDMSGLYYHYILCRGHILPVLNSE